MITKSAFDQLFEENEFPLQWKEEYIRLMTIFEVVVAIDKSHYLIPSHLPDQPLADPVVNLQPPLVRTLV